jgi:hypothetical protein
MLGRLIPAACLSILLLPALAAGGSLRYHATLDAKQRMHVRACLGEAHAQVRFAADSGWAKRFIADVAREGGRPLIAEDKGWSASDWHDGECLSYQVDLAAIAGQDKLDIGWRVDGDIVAAPQLWLLRPDVQDGDAQIEIDLPAGWSISAPWQALSRGEASTKGRNARFRIPDTPPDWSAAVAFGHFDEARIELPGGVLRVSLLGDVETAQRNKLRRWLDRVAHAVLTAYGRLPLADVQVLMIPVGSQKEAVMFGQSVRGQGNALQLLIDPSRPEAEFNADWMAVHELSHLMHPYLGDRGSWLAEGLATYYQNVLRARGGLLTSTQGWDRLQEGFRRGAAAPANGTLEQTAANMFRSHAFQRVYWSGAAFWLTVDRDLRRDSAGKIGLDTALSRFRDCCLPAYRQWRPEEFVAKLDALAGTTLVSARYREFAAMQPFPDWTQIYADLGIRQTGGRMSFDDAARDAAIREAIMRAK